MVYFRRLTAHIRYVHPLSEIICNINGCKSKYASIRAYIKHIKSKHFWFWEVNWKIDNGNNEVEAGSEVSFNGQENDQEIEFQDLANTVDNDGQEHPCHVENNNLDLDIDHVKIEDFVVSFLLELREEKKVSGVACEYVAQTISSLLDMICISQNNALKNLEDIIDEPQMTHFNDKWKNVSTNILKSLFDKYVNQKTFNAHIARQPHFVAPIEYRLNDENETKVDSFQYIPLYETLKILLSSEDYQKHIVNVPPSTPSRFCNFRDGIIFKQSEFWKSSPKHLQIFLYYDEFNCTNPLGNKVKKCKISAFYFVLGNLPRKKRSELASINLLLLCKSKYIENYGYAPILEPLIKDILDLEEKGIEIEINGVVQTLHGSLALIIADNLAQHGIGGFFENFSKTKRLCRYCMCSREDIATNFDEDKYLKRTAESYNLNINAISENPDLGRIYGIKQGCEFNKLNHFNLIGQQPFDLHHDFFEGVAIDVLSETVKTLIRDGFFTLDDLNYAISNFSYASCDKKDKPQTVNSPASLSNLKIKATAIEMSNMLRLFPMLIGDLIPDDNNAWTLFLKFIQIVELVLAPSLYRGEVMHLKDLIEEFLVQYIILFPEVTVKPKSHFITHYPSQILNLGVPTDHATIRFEAKHNVFKSIYHRSNNTINITKSLASRHQYLMYLHYKKNFLNDENITFVGGTEMPVALLDRNIQQKVLARQHTPQEVVFQGRSLCYGGQTYSRDLAVILSYENDYYVFGKIESAFNINEVYFLCIHKLNTISFNQHYNAYEVKDTDSIDLKQVEELLDYHPLGIYNVGGSMFDLIPMHHFVSPPD